MRILVVEDDEKLCGIICAHLNNSGFPTDSCHNGAEAYEMTVQYEYDLVLLDRMLPEKDGVSIVAEMRKNGDRTPVLMVTALNAVNDKVDGLDAGADDYLAKPFELTELSARIRALLRRPAVYNSKNELDCGGVRFIPSELKLVSEKAEISLSSRESALLEYFIRHDGQTLNREKIICSVWGADTEIENGNLDNYVYFLRRRLKAAESGATVKTVYGIGYKPEINRHE